MEHGTHQAREMLRILEVNMEKLDLGKAPVYSWAKDLDEKTIEQLTNIANHPKVSGHIAVMPDAHAGYGVPIGSVVVLEKAISPPMVGFDIGCGMNFVETSIKADSLSEEVLTEISDLIRGYVPMGLGVINENPICDYFLDANIEDIPEIYGEREHVFRSICTLGAGNHFIELQRNTKGRLCYMIHSGSRGFGHSIAEYYIRLANEATERNYPELVKQGLSFLDMSSSVAHDYIRDANLAYSFAFVNREYIACKVRKAITKCVKRFKTIASVDIKHNFVKLYGNMDRIHRKGAIEANFFGVIPGSMGTKSYLVKGLDSALSNYSASHGAGRVMARNAATKKLTLEEVEKVMGGIIHSEWKEYRKTGRLDLSEAPQAYKDIDEVMALQSDLVKIVDELTPLASIKG